MNRRLLAMVFGLVLALGVGCQTGDTQSTGVVELTCQKCEPSTENAFSQSRYDVVQAFNKQYKGKYEVKVQHWGASGEGDVQYWKRLALANALPDIFVESSSLLKDVGQSGKLFDFAPFLSKDGAWKDSFIPGSFTALTNASGQTLGIPETRDTIGIFWNKSLFAKAGIADGFPQTWDQFLVDCQKLKAAGVIPIAFDGDWTTLLIWADLIGTQQGGSDFLFSGIAKGNYANNSDVVKATEFLRSLQSSGYTNKDSFGGDYSNAGTPFLQEQAAMIANGPWMINGDIKGPNAKPGLYSRVGYAPAPGWSSDGAGAIVVAGGSGWAAKATTDAARQQAIIAFVKFTTTPDIQFQRTLKTGAYWAVKIKPTPDQVGQLEPLSYQLSTQSASLKYQFVHAKFASPQAFTDEWKNDWPAYAQGRMSTTDFLNKMSQAVTKASS